MVPIDGRRSCTTPLVPRLREQWPRPGIGLGGGSRDSRNCHFFASSPATVLRNEVLQATPPQAPGWSAT